MSHSLPIRQGSERSRLLDMLNDTGARRVLREPSPDLGLAEHLPFPFFAMVGQIEMRTALLLAVINPAVGGVLLIGPRGTGKTTCVRSLTDLLPYIEVSLCPEGCLPSDLDEDGSADVCQECQAKLEAGQPISAWDSVKLIELPLNARLEDVVGSINERIAVQQGRIRLERILARRPGSLYIDEVNLLNDLIVDAILDAAATLHRAPWGDGGHRSRSCHWLDGSEEGRLRPQIMDRFGLRVPVQGWSSATSGSRSTGRCGATIQPAEVPGGMGGSDRCRTRGFAGGARDTQGDGSR